MLYEQKENKLYFFNRLVGYIDGNIFVMKRNENKHFYRWLNSWNISVGIMNLIRNNIEFIKVETDIEVRIIEMSTIKKLRNMFNLYVNHTIFGQIDKQIAIPDYLFHFVDNKGATISDFSIIVNVHNSLYSNWRIRRK